MKAIRRGFTLLEVMIGLALLGLALTVLIKSAASSIFNAQQAHMTGVATNLARGKMYELEEGLMKDGFSDTDINEEDKTFEEEGWPAVRYSYKIEVVELPSMEELQRLAENGGMLGGMLGDGSGAKPVPGGSGSNAADAMGASFIQSQFQMFQQILKVSVRKVTLTVKWQVMSSERDMTVVAFFTDSAAMDKVLNGLGANPEPQNP